MMRHLLAVLLFALIWPVHAGEFWSGLWRNADQQGDALMQQGNASNAAKQYADPHRKAYAKMKAGDYQGAAKDLLELHDNDADYNRGNALAHAGDLQGAVDAYDAALKRDPNNQDAKHNRDLVANALKQQPLQQQKSADKQSQKGKEEGKKNGEQAKGQDSSGDNKQDDKSNPGEQNKEGEHGKSGSNKDKYNQINSKNQDKEDAKLQQDNKQSETSSKVNSQKEQQAEQEKNDRQAAAKNDAEQARRDAEASLGKPAADAKEGENDADKLNAQQLMSTKQAKSENQIAQEQWLRSIPDDPGGLLRRKFLIEHMMRQQKAQQ